MPVFQPRNRIQIIREMVARLVARSKLTGLNRNSVFFHLLAAAANEDTEQYVQLARLRNLFSIDRARGSDLDERAAEIVPGVIVRRTARFASNDVVFSRPGTTGTIPIPAGTQVGATDPQGQVRFRTTVAGEIAAGNTTSGNINVVCTIAGVRGNITSPNINQIVSRIPGITGVTNPSDFTNGRDRESDESFRARLKSFVQAISRATPNALEGFARQVVLADGRRVLFARLVEPILPTGTVELFIDDGTGSIEEFSNDFISSFDTFVASAIGGETDAFTTEKPIRDDGSFVLEVDSLLDAPSSGGGFVALTRGTDYELNAALGQIELLPGGAVPSLSAGYSLRANYRYYLGLIQETQRVIDGDVDDPLRRPGVRGAGVQVLVKPPLAIFQTLSASISVLDDFDPTVVAVDVRSAIQDYINSLDIGADVIVAEIVERSMAVTGMFNFRIIDLSGSGAGGVDQVILNNQVARITSGSITLT